MAESNNVSKTFRGEAHVSSKIKKILSVPDYFWDNSDNDDCTNMTVTTDDNHVYISSQFGNTATTRCEPRTFTDSDNENYGMRGMGILLTDIPKSIPITEDVINKPKHYNTEIFQQVIDMMITLFTKDEVLAFCKLNSFKYRMRAGVKDATKIEEDINKAIWYETKFKELNQIDTNLKQVLKG